MMIPPSASNMDQYLDVTVYTQNKEDCQWGVFDFSHVKINKHTGKVTTTRKKSDDLGKQPSDIEQHSFQMKGSSYITRQSKYKMTQTLPNESSNQIEMGALSVLQYPDSYKIYQNTDLKLDFTKQIKRNDDFISKLLKDLSKKSFMVIAASNTLG